MLSPTPELTRLTDLEQASGVLVGRSRPTGVDVPLPDWANADESPLQALERAVLPALRRAPCLVSFSGGMDSSFVLAVAARVARREGLPAPIPCTWRFGDAPRAYESPWQDRIVTELRLPDRVVLHADDDLDLVGPVAQRMLTRHGLLYPPNVHLHLPIVEQAAGGSLLTGVGGDQILSGWRRPGRSGLRRRARDATPSAVRAAVRQQRGHEAYPWLTRSVGRRVEASELHERAAEPRRFDHRVLWHAARRNLQTTCASLDLVGAGSDVLVMNPLVDPAFVAALAQSFRHRRGLPRAELLAELGSGALSPVITDPRPKAHFTEVFFRSTTRELVTHWDGQGVAPDLVDVERLREVWSHWPVPGATAPLVQQVWLSAQHPAAASAGPRAVPADTTSVPS